MGRNDGRRGAVMMAGRFARALVTVLLVIGGGIAAQGSDVPVAWQLVDEGWPNWFALLYYDEAAGRVGSIDLNSEGNAPRVWGLDRDDLWRRVFPDGDRPLLPVKCVGYDAGRDVLVRVDETGGTHELGSGGWSLVSVAGPPAPARCEMVYDASRGVMVYIGVESYDNDAPNATWEYDGTTWVEIHPTDPPPAGLNPELTYDSDRGVVVAYGEPFDESLPVFQAYVWEYDGITWTPVTPLGVATPGRRREHAWVYDPGRGEALLYAGIQDTVGVLADLWAWDGARWTRLEEEAEPGARTGCDAVYDVLADRIVFYGGGGVAPRERLTTWTWDDDGWTAVSSWNGPDGYSGGGMTVIPEQQTILVVGGGNGHSTSSDETWQWDEDGWRQDDLATPPTAFEAFDITYDESEGAVLGFGGLPFPIQIPVRDTHRYEGSGAGWDSEDLPGPRARRNAGIAYSRRLGRTLLFGGSIRDAQGVELDNSLWEFTGSGWSEVFVSAPVPEPREYCPLAPDEIRGVLWLYGGGGITQELSDLWSFDGAGWTLVSVDSPPGRRAIHGLAYDARRDRVVVFGDGPSTEEVTWEWGEGAWHARQTATRPEPERYVRLVYDPGREVVFLFGGQSGGPRYDLWAYGADPDQDGIVGRLDNCQDVVNPGQENLDGDPRGDACDCAVSDAGTWAVPPEVEGLVFEAAGDLLSWDDLDEAAGPDTVFDALRGSVEDLPLDESSPAICLEQGIGTPSLVEAAAPPPGVVWWYLVRGRNSCGAGAYGSATDGTERTNGACDGT